MELHKFAQVLFPFFAKGETEGEFVRTLLINIVDDEYPDNKGPYALSEGALRHYFNGNRKASKTARSILGNLDTNKFVLYAQSFNDDAQQCAFDALIPYCPDIESKTFAIQCADILTSCLQECALIKPGKSGAVDEQDRLVIEDGLRSLVRLLSEIDEPENLILLHYDAVKVSSKIGAYSNSNMSKLLANQITSHVVQFYCFVQEQIGLLEEAGQLRFEMLASAVQTQYVGLKEKGFDAVSVYYKMRNWVQKVANIEDELACEIVVSFFVQNCEVFDAPAK